MALLRYQLFTSYLIIFLALWKALLTNEKAVVENLSFLPEDISKLCIKFAPLLLLVGLALYALTSIGISMLSFKDCPEAAKEIEDQVKEAKLHLRKKGIIGF